VLGLVCQKLVDWIVCDECRDGNVENSGYYATSAGTVMSKTRDIMRRVQGRDVRNSGYLRGKHGDGLVKSLWIFFSGKCWGGKVRNLCLDTEMNDRIFSGSKGQRGRFGTLGKPSFRAGICREAVGVRNFHY
jgi:hypothetical protein